MCGIAGHWAFDAAALSEPRFRAFTAALAHRGPDGQGTEFFSSSRLHLGHRRLSIIDVSERGHQPMSYAEGRYWLTYNGEVYNYLELREELRGLGHRFKSDTDSEVILAAFAQWGPACQLRFNGMWAIAIWDAKEKTLFLSRDRFGIKPLHYMYSGGTFAFASELKAFLALPGVTGTLDETVVAATLANINGQESTPETLLPSIKRLPGGHSLTIDANGSVTIEVWWRTLDHLPDVASTFANQSQEFRRIFLDACRLRLRSDVAVATSLSGGLDSSAVACTIAELGRRGHVDHAPADWQRAFIAQFPGSNLDETVYADAVVKSTSLSAHYHPIDDVGALKNIERLVFDYEGIYWVPLLGPWAIYREMQTSGIRVSLDGHGADELLGGYHFFVERALDAVMSKRLDLRRYLDLKRVLAGLVGGSGDVTRAGILGDINWLMKKQLQRWQLVEPLRGAALRARTLWHRLAASIPSGSPRLASAAMDPVPPPAAEPVFRPFAQSARLYDEASDPRTVGMSPLSAMLFSWFHGSVLPTILRSYDRASMAHGIEVRMPFMDWRLVTYGFALPETSKIGGGYTKRILREAMRGLMPESIRLRTNKIGFTSPLDEWARGAMKAWLLDTVSSRRFTESAVWNGPAVRNTVERSVRGAGSLNPVWPIINAHVISETFAAAARRHGAHD
ncbi:MAG TPA: asparagine synthase (glutamine-hydrolyzing) [Stellaceae bacterium]|nr:asparagine synthase (glutamine-hydrolyzing) [Stellaceae bacterium]